MSIHSANLSTINTPMDHGVAACRLHTLRKARVIYQLRVHNHLLQHPPQLLP